MQVLLYDLYLLFIKARTKVFAITGMQIDDILSFATSAFSTKEEIQLYETGFLAKSKTYLSHEQLLEFNGCKLQLEGDIIIII